jgi:hypothetical protein
MVKGQKLRSLRLHQEIGTVRAMNSSTGQSLDSSYPLSNEREMSVRYLLCEAPEGRVHRKRYRTLFSRTFKLFSTHLLGTLFGSRQLAFLLGHTDTDLWIGSLTTDDAKPGMHLF